MISSEPSEQVKENQDSYCDDNTIETLKQTVCLNNHQLLELTYNDQKFYQKLKQLNHHGCLHIQKLQYTEALIYLTEAEKVLEYAASCGKTIERKLIITTLNNEASLYQKAWELQKAESYLEAIIYNISSFFENSSENQNTNKNLKFTKNILDQNSTEYQDFSIALWRKKSLVIFYLQYCAINSQNKNNQRAFSSALKAVSLIKQISMDFYNYEHFLQQNGVFKDQMWNFAVGDLKNFLYQLATFKDIDRTKVDFEHFYKKTVIYIAAYIKRLQLLESEDQQKLQTYKDCFQNYSIGTIMQINPIDLDQQTDNLNLKNEISMIQKHFKAIYLSVGHFILGTEARFIAAEKYTLDEDERKKSPEFKESQIYHLCSIIILTKFLLCQSGYFDHIVNSFRNHYKLDVLQDARKYLESNPNLSIEDTFEDDELFQHQSREQLPRFQVKEIENLNSEIQTVQEIQGGTPQQNGLMFNIETEESQQVNEGPITPKEKTSKNIKNTKQSKNTASSQNGPSRQTNHIKEPITTLKKSQTKKLSNNPLTKSQTRLQAQEANRMTTSQNENKNFQKAVHMLTSREKENKIKSTHLHGNVKSSRSNRKSDYQFIISNKKPQLINDRIAQKTVEKNEVEKQTVYTKRQSDYGTITNSKSKNKRIPTSNEGDRKMVRRKDSFAEIKKTKKVDNQYGMGSSSKNINLQKIELRTNKHTLLPSTKDMKKSKNRRESDEKIIKLTSPELKFKKMKSPRANKK